MTAPIISAPADEPDKRHLHAVDTPTDGIPDPTDPMPAAAPQRDTRPDIDPDTNPDTRPDTNPDTEADTEPDGAPDTRPDTTPDKAPGKTKGDVGEIVPGWLKSWPGFTGMVRERSLRRARLCGFHTVRFPAYWYRLTRRSPRTLGRMARWVFDWATDAKGREVRRAVAYGTSMGGHEATAFHRVTEQHREAMKLRLAFTAITGVILAGAGWRVAPLVPTWAWVGAAVLTLPPLGWFSRDKDTPIVTRADPMATGVPVFDKALIVAALDGLGIATLSKGMKVDGLRLVAPIHRDGPGWRADIDLPGVPAGDVIDRRDKLAAGLRRPLACVWPEPDPDAHEARLILWVGDKALNQTKPKPWPLIKTGRTDLFKTVPIGVDQRGKPVGLCLMFASMLIGAVPRMGKTFSLRVILLAAALDALAELHVYDLKGGADMRPLAMVAHRFRIGDEDEDIAYLASDMAELKTEMSRRYKVLRSLPQRICPEGKVTPELAARKEYGLHPIVVSIDETQFGFEHVKYGAKLDADITDLVKRGPAVGIIVILATQRPDAKSIPTGISANAVIRFCLKVMNPTANDMVLGGGMNKAGIKASMFARSDKGTGYLVGEGDDPQIVQFAYIDGPTAQMIADRARAMRHLAGTLSGYAADLDQSIGDEDPVPTLLDDLTAVMATTEPRVWSDVLLERLIELRPDTYTGWSTTDLGNAAGAYGIKTVQIGKQKDGKYVNRKGIDRADIITAVTDRDERKGA